MSTNDKVNSVGASMVTQPAVPNSPDGLPGPLGSLTPEQVAALKQQLNDQMAGGAPMQGTEAYNAMMTKMNELAQAQEHKFTQSQLDAMKAQRDEAIAAKKAMSEQQAVAVPGNVPVDPGAPNIDPMNQAVTNELAPSSYTPSPYTPPPDPLSSLTPEQLAQLKRDDPAALSNLQMQSEQNAMAVDALNAQMKQQKLDMLEAQRRAVLAASQAPQPVAEGPGDAFVTPDNTVADLPPGWDPETDLSLSQPVSEAPTDPSALTQKERVALADSTTRADQVADKPPAADPGPLGGIGSATQAAIDAMNKAKG